MFEQSMKAVGFVVNALMLTFFVYLSLRFTSGGLAYLTDVGGMSHIYAIVKTLKDPIALINSMVSSLSTGTFFSAAVSYAGAWAMLIAAGGCWWMTALGARWLFFALKRSISS